MDADRQAPGGKPREGVLVINAGSSSIKAAVFTTDTDERPVVTSLAERIGGPDAACTIRDADGKAVESGPLPDAAGASHEAVLGWLLPKLQAAARVTIAAAGHRIVHGGADFTRPVAIDDAVLEVLERLVPLARTHQPHGLAAVRAVGSIWPHLSQIACFDTAFHATIPEVARTIALPRAITAKGVRRYGFHGLSYQWIASRLPDVLSGLADGRVIVAHLGNGASLCGMVGRESRATTMGFTPLDGLVMGERPGLTDPGAVLFLLEELGMSTEEVRRMLFRESGLLGISGLSNDMRTLLASSDPAARLAIDVYVHRAVREIGAIAAEIGGLDALVFTAGVGENAAPIRAAIVEGCAWLGAALDEQTNTEGRTRLSPDSARVPAFIIPTNEEAVIASQTRAVLTN